MKRNRIPILREVDASANESDADHIRGAKYANLLLDTDYGKGDVIEMYRLDRIGSEFFERVERSRPAITDDPMYRQFKRDLSEGKGVICVEDTDRLPEEFDALHPFVADSPELHSVIADAPEDGRACPECGGTLKDPPLDFLVCIDCSAMPIPCHNSACDGWMQDTDERRQINDHEATAVYQCPQCGDEWESGPSPHPSEGEHERIREAERSARGLVSPDERSGPGGDRQ